MINLCFHGVGTPSRELEPGEAPYWISEDFFGEVLDLVVERTDVRLSFDDGNACDVAIALPELHKRGLRAAFFPVADRIGVGGSIDGAGLRELVRSGMTIGSHGMRHRPWRGMGAEQLDEELVEGRRIIAAEAGVVVNDAACPLGSYDRRALVRLRRLGYRRVFTSDRARARAGRWLQPRYSIRNTDDGASVRRLLAERPQVREQALASARVAVKRWR